MRIFDYYIYCECTVPLIGDLGQTKNKGWYSSVGCAFGLNVVARESERAALRKRANTRRNMQDIREMERRICKRIKGKYPYFSHE